MAFFQDLKDVSKVLTSSGQVGTAEHELQETAHFATVLVADRRCEIPAQMDRTTLPGCS